MEPLTDQKQPGGPHPGQNKVLYNGRSFKIVYFPQERRSAKIFNKPIPSKSKTAWKIRTLMEHQPGTNNIQANGVKIGWPLETIEEDETVKGYYMPTVTKKQWKIDDLYEPKNRMEKDFTNAGCKTVLSAAINLSKAFDMTHNLTLDNSNLPLQCVVGNIADSNILVDEDANILLINPERYQFKYRENGNDVELHARKGSSKFMPKESQDIKFHKEMLDPSHDHFGLAVLLFLLLMDGTHPFDYARGKSGYTNRIKNRTFSPRKGPSPYPPKINSPDFNQFPDDLQQKFKKSFLLGHFSPKFRLKANQWADYLENLKKEHCENDCLLKNPEKCFNENKSSECCLCHLSVKTVVALMLESPRSTRELTELLIKGPRTQEKTNKMRATCYRLRKYGWITSRKFPAGRSMNFFPVTGEVVLPQNRKRIYKTINALITLIEEYPASISRIKQYFKTLRKNASSKREEQRIDESLDKLLTALKKKEEQEALWQTGLIPFTQKVLVWNINFKLPLKDYERFIHKNPFPVSMAA